MSKKLRIFQVVLGIVMLALVVITPASGIANAAIFPMTEAGENLEWEVTDKYVLKITGEGPMYDSYGAIAPWFEIEFNTVEIAEGVTTLGGSMLCDYRVAKITLPNTLEAIKEYGLCGSRIYSITIPESVKTIEEYALSECEKLTTVIVLNPQTHFEDNVFYKSPNVTICGLTNSTAEAYAQANDIPFVAIDEYVNGENKCGDAVLWKIENGRLKIYGYGDMYDYEATNAPWKGKRFGGIEVLEGVTSIGNYAFARSNETYNASEIELPKSIISIGDYAYYYFGSQGSPQNLYIPENVIRIGKSAFEQVVAMMRVVIGGCVVIEEDAFEGCWRLQDIVVLDKEPRVSGRFHITDYVIATRIFGHPDTRLGAYVEEYKQEDELFYIPFDDAEYPYFCGDTMIWDTYTFERYMHISGGGAMYNYERGTAPWYGQKFENLNFLGPVDHIGNWAFYRSESLVNVNIGEYVETIGDYAFFDCNKFEQVIIPENVSTIGDFAFADCDKLGLVTILNKDAQIEPNAFVGSPVAICGYIGSTAQAYAEEYGFTFTPICECGGFEYENLSITGSCSADGYTDYMCKKCSTIVSIKTTDRVGHDYKLSISYDDYDLYVCSECGRRNYRYHEVENFDPDHESLRPRYGIGSNKDLSGNVHVVAFFLSDTDSTGVLDQWADETYPFMPYYRVGKISAKEMVENGVDYLERLAAQYDVSVNFSVEFVDVEVDDAALDATENNGLVLEELSSALNYNSVAEMRAEYKEKANTEEVVFLVLSPRLHRSYAMPDCWPNDGDEDEEYCVLFRQNFTTIASGYHTSNISSSAVIHELLHLYGALDLYNNNGYHADRDEMVSKNYEYEIMLDVLDDKYLSNNELSEITAYGIGWIDEVPVELYMPEFYEKGEYDYRNTFYIARADVSIGSKIAINFYVNSAVLADCDLTQTKVIVNKPIYNMDGSIDDYATTEISEFVEQKIGNTLYYVFSFDEIDIADITAEIEASISTVKEFVENGTTTRRSYVGAKVNYSVKQYVIETLETSTDAEYKTLLVDLLNYSTVNQIYLSYNLANLANEGLTAEQQALATQEASIYEQLYGDYTAGAKVSLYGTELLTHNNCGYRMYFQFNGMAAKDVYITCTYTDKYGVFHETIIDGSKLRRINSKIYDCFYFGPNLDDISAVVTVAVYSKNTDELVSSTQKKTIGRSLSGGLSSKYVKEETKIYNEMMLKYGVSLEKYLLRQYNNTL